MKQEEKDELYEMLKNAIGYKDVIMNIFTDIAWTEIKKGKDIWVEKLKTDEITRLEEQIAKDQARLDDLKKDVTPIPPAPIQK